MASVVHCKKKKYNIYAGRAYSMMPQSPYHNPYHIGRDGDRDEVILKFAIYWYAEEQRELRARARREASYSIFGCWCDVPKQKCHAEIVAGYLNWREVFESPTKLEE